MAFQMRLFCTSRILKTGGSLDSKDLMLLKQHLVASMKAKTKQRTMVIRSCLSEITNMQKIANHRPITVSSVVQKQIRKRHESVTAFRGGGRLDLVEIEMQEVGILESLLPKQLQDAEIAGLLQVVIAELEVCGVAASFGNVMKAVGTNASLGEDVAPKARIAVILKGLLQ